MLVWLFLSALFARVTTLSFSEARLKIGKGFLLLLPLAFYGLKLKWAIPHLGLILPFLSLTALVVCLIVIYFQNRDRLAGFDWVSIKGLVLGVGTGLALATAYLMHVRRTVFLPSLAGKGRVISEVLLFSPRMENLFFWQDINQERFVLLGWGLTILAVIGLLPLFKKRSGNQGYLAMAALMAFMALVLTLGPTLTDFPVYEILYRYFPFFNYPRVPGRFVMVGFIFLSLLAASALASLRSWLSKRGWPRLSLSMTGMIIILMVSEYHTWQPVGLSLMSKENRIYETVRQQMPQGKVLLELPIWPGDSHQSAAYEYAVTLTAKPMVNGYAPVVIRDYIQKVFWPLYPMDQGEFGETQEKELDRIGVDFITFHDNPQIFTEKVSPFPPRLALKRLLSSPSLKLVNQDQDIFLFRKDGSFSEEGPDRGSDITSPVKAVYYVNSLPHETGNYQFERAASGFNLLMEEKGLSQGQFFPKAGARGNVVSAVPGKDPPGFLTLGTQRFFPSGRYKALFRLKSGMAGTQVPIGRIEILQGKTSVIAQRTLFNRDFMNDGDWSDIPLEFQILQAGDVGFRVYYSGQAPLSLNIILIGFMDQGNGAGSVEAEDLLRQTGTVVSDPSASGKEAVLAHAGFHPPIYICYGPYRTLKPGKYRAKFFMRLKDSNRISPETELALLEMATDMGKRIFSQRKIKAQDLQADAYRSVDIDFEVPFRCELGYRVKFTGKADLLVDRISVESR
ncbi:MAG TPA: hypothetical protein VK564_08415, partial [Thermodesulfobacteriota bacterium]|nr:hypothetical protein [Thermodesulfobacteriota bacterium]